MPAGSVYVFNPTGTDYTIFVNGQTPLSLPGTSGTTSWAAGTTTKPVPRNSGGNPQDGQFGYHDNHVRVSPAAGQGEDAQFDLTIDTKYQIGNDFQLYVFYDPDFAQATYVALDQGAIIEQGGIQKA
jgi:hypothetical protein